MSEIDSLKNVFIEIMKSEEYINFHKDVDEMVAKMKNANVSFKNKEEFNNWLTLNLDKTYFNNINEALNLHDKSINNLNKIHTKYKSFYDILPNLKSGEFTIIFEPEMTNPLNEVQYNEECAQGCVDTAIQQYHLSDISYQYTVLANSDNGNLIYWATYAHDKEQKSIFAQYQSCFAGCV